MSNNSQTVKYTITFFEPDDPGREGAEFVAATPFQSVHVGDMLLGRTWRDSSYPCPPEHDLDEVARVTKVTRSVSRVLDVIYDVTLVYCESVKVED